MAEIGEDTLSSDFGSATIGNTRLNPLAGVSQVIVFGARTYTGKKTTWSGNTVAIRGEGMNTHQARNGSKATIYDAKK